MKRKKVAGSSRDPPSGRNTGTVYLLPLSALLFLTAAIALWSWRAAIPDESGAPPIQTSPVQREEIGSRKYR
jgi:hypothetical protein